jgi:hypothetical protein
MRKKKKAFCFTRTSSTISIFANKGICLCCLRKTVLSSILSLLGDDMPSALPTLTLFAVRTHILRCGLQLSSSASPTHGKIPAAEGSRNFQLSLEENGRIAGVIPTFLGSSFYKENLGWGPRSESRLAGAEA